MRLLTIVMWLAPVAVFPADPRVAGGDLLGPDFAEALGGFAKRENVTVVATFKGSRAGMDDLEMTRADVTLIAFAPGEMLPDGASVA